MLDIRIDRLTKRLLYLTVLLGVIGTTAHAETTQLGALHQEIVTGVERSLVAPDWTLVAKSAMPSRERKSPPSTNFNSLTGNSFASLNAVPTTRGGRVDVTAAEDMYLFHIPLTGNIQGFGFRLAMADGGKFGGLTQQAFFVDFKLPWMWSPWTNVSASPKLTLETGRFNHGSENRYFASLGPTLRLANDQWRMPLFMDLGLSPTVIVGATYGDRHFGTSFNFTSHIALGFRFGQTRNHVVKLRYQHISSGSFDEVNSGVNMIGIDVVLWAR